MRHGKGARVQVRIYLEGRLIESAGSSVMVHGSTGAPATCQINLAPTNTIKHILPFTRVSVFTTDPWEQTPAGDLSDFKLLFEGVVVARGFERKQDARSFVIQCADPSIFWSEARQFWLNIANAGGGIVDQLAIQTSGGYGRFGMLEQSGVYGYAASKLVSQTDDPEERFLDNLISILDDVGNVNPYYTNARNRFRITDRILRASAGATDKLFQLELFGDFVNGLAQRTSGQTNLAEMVNMLLGAILHEWVSVPAPPYVQARIFDRDVFGNIKRQSQSVQVVDSSGTTTTQLYSFQTALDQILGTLIFKPHIYSLSPPTCNVLFPNMYDSIGFNESFLEEPTRIAARPQLITRELETLNTFGMLLQRPTELETFTSLTRDPATMARLARDPDAFFADGAGQAPVYTDYDWTTNEERLRGIVYEFINMGPAPSTLTLTDQGTRQPDGTRTGGMPKYLQNVISYEYFKSKFVSRQTPLSGPYNMRPVPGFSMLAVDDSAANLNIIGYLDEITHTITADGQGYTQYGLKYPRLADEIDLNRPHFQGGLNQNATIDLGLATAPDGSFQFDNLFDGHLRPPIPEWFSDDYKTLTGLDVTYEKFFGNNVGVIESILFNNPLQVGVATGELVGEITGSILVGLETAVQTAEATAAANNAIDQNDAVVALANAFRGARSAGREFEYTSAYTARSFAKIDQAFLFVGAMPKEYAGTLATERVIDYKNAKFDHFVGDISLGAGYNAQSEPGSTAPPATTVTDVTLADVGAIGSVISTGTAGTAGTAVSETGAGTTILGTSSTPANHMSGAFPQFDTQIHTGAEATDADARSAAVNNQLTASLYARFDGRPVMFDFEFRLWQASLGPASVQAAPTVPGDYTQTSGVGAPTSATDQAAAAQSRFASIAGAAVSGATAGAASNLTPDQQAPTGDSVESSTKVPLSQPLSEMQAIQLRKAVVDAYVEELGASRGFAG